MTLFRDITPRRPHKLTGYSVEVEPCRWSTDERPEYAAVLYSGREAITGACGACALDAAWRALRFGVARLGTKGAAA